MTQNSSSSRYEPGNPNTIDPNQSTNLVLGQLTSNNGPAHGLPAERRHAINRRDGVWQAFMYGNFRPRRRISRRTADEYRFLFDWHEPRILYLALGVLLLSCTDALFTLNLLNAGASEANAVMASMLDAGVDRFLASKIGITSFSLIILVAAARRKFFRSFSVEHLLQVLCAGYILVICYEVYLFKYVFDLNIFPGHLIPW
ncbi:MAG: DUF5658 family protein [Nitrosomonadaceae bacterium]